MKSFEFVVNDPVGIHARPAGQLVKEVKNLIGSKVTITKGEKSADALRLMAVMQLGVKKGDTVTVSVEGGNEEAAAAALEQFFKDNFSGNN